MNKHTPAPWRIVKDGNFHSIEADLGKGWNNPILCHLYSDVTPEDSVTIGPWYEAFDNDEANARLIAAAPDLLDVLLRARDVIEALDGTSVENEQLVDAYRAAIAKAKGEQSC